MSQSLIGSRYETHIAKKGAQESKDARDYFAIHPGDIEEAQEGDDITGYVHSYEVGSTVDGPGIRFVAFLTGCLLRCQYCHNPDTWHKHNGKPVTVLFGGAERSGGVSSAIGAQRVKPALSGRRTRQYWHTHGNL